MSRADYHHDVKSQRASPSQPIRLMRYHDGSGYRAALVTEGRTKLHVVSITDCGVRHESLALTEVRYMTELPGDPRRAARRMLKAGRRVGITKAARAILSQQDKPNE